MYYTNNLYFTLLKKMKKFGFGTMRLLVDLHGNIDEKLLCDMIDLFIKNGSSYFDTAYGYMGKKAEKTIKRCLVERYRREQYIIADKLTLSQIDKFSSLEDYFETQLNNLGVADINIYLLHGLDNYKYQLVKKRDCFKFISALKACGKIKYAGISFHDKADVLERILSEQNDIDYVQLQLNYLDWRDDLVEAEKCLGVAKKINKRVIVMEPLKGGLLTSADILNEEKVKLLDTNMSFASWGIRFAASQSNVDMVLSGMNSMEQMYDNVSFMKDFIPLLKEEEEILLDLAKEYKEINVILCTKCEYCMGVCPQGLNIPKLLYMLNEVKKSNNKSIVYNMRTKKY